MYVLIKNVRFPSNSECWIICSMHEGQKFVNQLWSQGRTCQPRSAQLTLHMLNYSKHMLMLYIRRDLLVLTKCYIYFTECTICVFFTNVLYSLMCFLLHVLLWCIWICGMYLSAVCTLSIWISGYSQFLISAPRCLHNDTGLWRSNSDVVA